MEEARQEFAEALQIRRELAQKNPEIYWPDAARTLNNLGILDSDQGRMEEAGKEFAEALQIRRELAQKNPETYRPDVAERSTTWGFLIATRAGWRRPSRNIWKRCRFTKPLPGKIQRGSRPMSRG